MEVILHKFYLEHQLDKELPSQKDQERWLAEIMHELIDPFPGNSFPGYRNGVLLVPITNIFNFKHKTITLKRGDKLEATYEPRVEGEEPRKHTIFKCTKDDLPIAPYVFAILYNKDVLAEDNDFINADWAVVAHTTSSIPEPEPMGVGTLISNHVHLDGGTRTNMSSEEFEDALKKSVLYWKDKCVATLVD